MSTPSETAPADQDALPTEQKTAAVVYNPVKVHLETLKSTVAKHQQEAGWAETLWFETTEEDPGGGMTKAALEAGADVVAAAGGDGTVRAVAEVVHGSAAALALLPSGTGNLLARNIPSPIDDLGASVRTIFRGEDRPIDIGEVQVERPDGSREEFGFVVMAGLGLDARMLVNTKPELKKKVGWLAYVGGIARSLGGKNYIRLRFKLDEEPARNLRVNTMLIGNCGLLTGNILLLPDAVVDDGVFDIVTLRPEGFFGWVQIWIKIVWENGVLRRSQVGRKLMGFTKEVRTLRYYRVAQLAVTLERPEEFELDGDEFGTVVAFRAHIDPAALVVRMPRS